MATGEPVLDAVEHTEEPVGVVGGGIEPVEHFSDLVEDALVGAGLHVTGKVQNLLECLGEAFAVSCCGGLGRGWQRDGGRRRVGMTGEFVEADGDGLTQVEGFLRGLGGDVEDGGAVGAVVVAEAAFF